MDNITENLQYLRDTAWKRVLWYRDEMWKISISLYTGLAGFIAVSLQFPTNSPNKPIIALIAFAVGAILIFLYFLYLNSLAKAAKNCNDTLELRERHLCRYLNLSSTTGFRTDDEFIDTKYDYLREQKPTIEVLKVSIAIFLLLLGCGYIFL